MAFPPVHETVDAAHNREILPGFPVHPDIPLSEPGSIYLIFVVFFRDQAWRRRRAKTVRPGLSETYAFSHKASEHDAAAKTDGRAPHGARVLSLTGFFFALPGLAPPSLKTSTSCVRLSPDRFTEGTIVNVLKFYNERSLFFCENGPSQIMSSDHPLNVHQFIDYQIMCL